MSPPRWQTWTGLGLVYVVWGSTYLAIRYVLESLPPLLTAGCRFLTASALLGGFLLVRRRRTVRPSGRQVVEMLAGAAGFWVAGLLRGESPHLHDVRTVSVVAFAYLVVFGSIVAFTAYSWLLGTAPISLVSTYAYVNPVVAVLLGAAFVGEPVGPTTLVGGAITVAAEESRRRAAPVAAAPEPVPDRRP
jgi:drug/metabolite transporter (DMT)-like permease